MTYEERRLLPIIRVLISAKSFYENIIANKKQKDKKNRRAEQTLVMNSKILQNMAAQSLLGGISVSANPTNGSSSHSNTTLITTSITTSTSTRESEGKLGKDNDTNILNDKYGRHRKDGSSGSSSSSSNTETGTGTGTDTCTIPGSKPSPPYLLKIFLAGIAIEFKSISEMEKRCSFAHYSPYEKLEKGSRRIVERERESLRQKRRISYTSVDPDNDLDLEDSLHDSENENESRSKNDAKNQCDRSNYRDDGNDDNDDDTNYNGDSEKDRESKGAFEDYYENVLSTGRRDEEENVLSTGRRDEEEGDEEVKEVEVAEELANGVEKEGVTAGDDGKIDVTVPVESASFETEPGMKMDADVEVEEEVC